MSTSEVWHAVRTAYVQVNGGEGENLSGMLQGVIIPLERVMLARPPLTDRNGRDTGNMHARRFPPSGAGEYGPDGKGATAPSYEEAMRRTSDLESTLSAATNTIVQAKTNSEKYKAARQANWEKRQAKR